MDLKALISLTGKTKSTIQGYLRDQDVVYVRSKNIYNVYNETFFDVAGLTVSFKFKGRRCHAIIIHQSYEDDVTANQSVQQLRTGLIETLGIPTSDNHKHPATNVFVTWEKDSYIQLNQTPKLKRLYIYMTPRKLKQPNMKKVIWTISMFGGLLFGLLMFILLGIGLGFDLMSFIINMIGGLVWGVLFGFFMNLSLGKNPIDPFKMTLTKRDKRFFENYRLGLSDIEGEVLCLCAFQTKFGLQYFKTAIFLYDHKAVFAYLRRGRLFEMTLPYANIDLYIHDFEDKEVVVWLNNKTKLIIRNREGLKTLKDRLDWILGYQEDSYQALEKYIIEVLKDYDLMGLLAGGASESVIIYDGQSIARYLYKERPLEVGDVNQVLLTYFEGIPIDSLDDLASRIFAFYKNE
ncbi:hypothetical protein N7548_07460 [Acholeplasma manati]|uniref:Uncharacterized protein n=1 Tax=Paracholeplasma manati TaxID=591373 RepID=A0ABT2Y843_9MOLU|nr:hypothetical protein [Paracholeplasma manati]MCV2232652.1 hypothetical protein [Paracholeplasma manati]